MREHRGRAVILFATLAFLDIGSLIAMAAEKAGLTVAETKGPVSNAMLKEASFAGTQTCKESHAKEFEA
jgi:hypothetical protein